MPDRRPSVRELVLVPAIITLAITALRLIGELQHWSETFFSRAPGGGFALVGISWLPFLFGGYFATRLARAGEGPARTGRAIGFSLLAIVVLVAPVAIVGALKLPPVVQLLTAGVASLVGGWVATLGWSGLGRVLLAYALAARVPVAALMLPAILGHWGTHYDVLPPNVPAMGPVITWVMIGLLPQMTVWIGFTLIVGMLVGSITAAVVGGKRRQTVADAA